MIRDLHQGAPAERQRADVCVVGAGAAGISLAVELVRRGRSVLLLEGGGPEVEEHSQEPYRSEITGLRHDGVHIGRFRAAGGSTTRWGGQILELDAIDFEQRPGVEGDGWPFAKSELTPYYARATELEGIRQETLDDTAVWREIGLQPPALDSLEPFFSRWCPEPNFARLHGTVLEQSAALTVWLHANAVQASFVGERFDKIQAKTLGGVEAEFFADNFVFCLGGIESSRFFLQPAASGGPWRRSGLLGRHFQDHIICAGATIRSGKDPGLHAIFDNIFSRGFKYQPKVRLSPARQAAEGLLNVAGTVSWVGDAEQIVAQLKNAAKRVLHGRGRELSRRELALTVRHLPLLLRHAYRYRVQHRAYNPPGGRVELLVHCEQQPLSRSSITLAQERDSLGLYRTRLDWKIAEQELRSIRSFVQVAARSLASLGHVIPDPDLLDLNPRFVERCGDGYHHMGGMRMSQSPSSGVVDPDLRLHGMQNGYVLSSAVFPTSGFSNPTHTLIALAVRLAEHLA